MADCGNCDGSGKVWVTSGTGPDYRKPCGTCGGTGQASNDEESQ